MLLGYMHVKYKTNSLPLVSVIIPAFNEEKNIEFCLKSLRNQTYKMPIEVIVVDDGSTDQTSQVARQFTRNVFSCKHLGPGAAKNFGAKMAKGDVLVFLDADMYIDKDYINCIIKPIQEGFAVASFTKEEFVANLDNIWARFWNINNGLLIKRRLREDYSERDVACRAIVRTFFLERGGFNSKLGYVDDMFFTKKSKYKAKVAPGAIAYHINPSTLKDVFYSARWIGRNPALPRTPRNVLRYSIINSFRVSFEKIAKGKAPFLFVVFKIIFDLGVLIGILFKNKSANFAK